MHPLATTPIYRVFPWLCICARGCKKNEDVFDEKEAD